MTHKPAPNFMSAPPGAMRRRALLLLALIGSFSAGAATLADSDARAVRAVVQAQLDAFAADDAERAYGFASPAIRSQFSDAATFMAMVRTGYPMVIQPASVSFFQPEWADGAVLQKVQLRDRAGRLWLATYQLEQQASAGWRINGCVVAPDAGKSLI